jgi:type 1 fimbria pilin
MKTLNITLLLLGAVALASGTSKSRFHGEISDTQCAMNVHSLSRSHEEMITKQSIGTDAASCARECIRRGGEWVLRSGNDVYRLKNQAGIEEFAGQKVQITGTLDTKTNTIDNVSIEVAPATRHSENQK